MSTNGVANRGYLFAGNGGPSVTVNGVTFSQFVDQGSDTTTFDGSGNGVLGSANPPYSNLSTAYHSLLSNAYFNFTPNTNATLTLNGLSIGTSYEVQVWVNDSRGSTRSQTVSGSPTLLYNTTNTDGGLGQYVIGTFVADSTSQVLTFAPTSGSVAQLNALQLRTIVPASVPESSGVWMFSPIALVFFAYRRKHPKTSSN